MLSQDVSAWVKDKIGIYKLTKLNGDASFRQYFRCQAATNFILSYESTQNNQVEQSVQRFKALQKNNIPTPKVHFYCKNLGVTLQEDLGNSTLWDIRNTEIFMHWAGKSIKYIHKIINSKIDALDVLAL